MKPDPIKATTRRSLRAVRGVFVLLSLNGLAACDSDASDVPATRSLVGTVVVLVTDHRDAIGDFSSAIVAIEGVELHRRGAAREAGWVRIDGVAGSVDLTQYTDSNHRLGSGMVPARRYDAIRLLAGPIAGTLAMAAGATAARATVAVAFTPQPIAVNLQVAPTTVTELLIDITVSDVRDHPGETYRGVVLSATIIGG